MDKCASNTRAGFCPIKSVRVNCVHIYHRVKHGVHPSDRIRVDIGDIYLVPNKGSDVFYLCIKWTDLFISGSGHYVDDGYGHSEQNSKEDISI